jgi:serine protease Do
VITEFDGKPIDEMRKLPRDVADTEIDKSVTVTLIRNGKEMEKTVKVAEMPQTEEEQENPEDEDNGGEAPAPTGTKVAGLGVDVGPITPDAKQQYGIGDDVKGLLVLKVDPAGPSSDKGVTAGDVITSINQEPVTKPADLTAKVAEAKKSGKKSVLLLVERHGEIRFVAINLTGGGKSDDSGAPGGK